MIIQGCFVQRERVGSYVIYRGVEEPMSPVLLQGSRGKTFVSAQQHQNGKGNAKFYDAEGILLFALYALY